MVSFKGSQTEKNLLTAFAGESQARNRYTYFASQAKKEGLEQIAAIFLETADNEKEHAKRFFNMLQGGTAEFTATFPAGVVGDTKANLKASAAGENEEHTKLYPAFARVAQEEGIFEVSTLFKSVASVEVQHEKRYLALLANLERDKVFSKAEPVRWKCRNCGYIHEGKDAPALCPTCLHPQAYFELQCECY
jgi:rubrerythrin